MTLQHEGDTIYRIDINGLLTKDEFDRCQAALAAEIQQRGTVRLLVVVSRFTGWERGRDWGDLSFYLQHGDAIERIAIAGDDRWRSELLMFASADLRRAPVEYFASPTAVEDARTWLATSSRSSS
jgi:hypothetical protein